MQVVLREHRREMKEEIGYVIVWEKSNDDNLEDAALRG